MGVRIRQQDGKWYVCITHQGTRKAKCGGMANDIAQTYHGMMIAIPEDEWRVFSRMRPAEMVATLKELAQKVRLKAYRKSPRGPKKPRPKREGTTKAPHVSTAKLLRERTVNAATP